jgi:hypothetical protein
MQEQELLADAISKPRLQSCKECNSELTAESTMPSHHACALLVCLCDCQEDGVLLCVHLVHQPRQHVAAVAAALHHHLQACTPQQQQQQQQQQLWVNTWCMIWFTVEIGHPSSESLGHYLAEMLKVAMLPAHAAARIADGLS